MKNKQTKSVEVLRRTKQNFNAGKIKQDENKKKNMKKSCMLKLKPVQPRRKKRISSSEIMKLIDPVKSVESSSQVAERDLFSPTDRKRNSKVFSPQTDEKDKRVLLLSLEYNSQALTDRDVMSSAALKDINYAMDNYAIMSQVNHESERPVQLINEGKFIERVSKHKNIEGSSRVSTIDTNVISQTDRTGENFLKNSRKRVKNSYNRYFNDERVSLPQIQAIKRLNAESTFGMKKIS